MNEGNYHWNGWAAVNPWAQLARVLYEHAKKHSKENKNEYSFYCGYRKLANGLISCDGLSTKGIADSRCIIWFLNLASVYHDMAFDKKMHAFNVFNNMPRSYWMLGCSGPFGKLDVRSDSMITYKILTLHKDVRPIQPVETDSYNCGLIWCLFVYDMMLQVTVSYYNILPQDSRELPLSLGIGKTWLHPRVYSFLQQNKSVLLNKSEKDHYRLMCNDL